MSEYAHNQQDSPEFDYNVATREKYGMPLRSFFQLAIVPALLGVLCFAQQGASDLNGKQFDPVKANPGKVVVLIFVRRDCPVSGRYAPTIQRVSDEHGSATRFYLVFPDKTDSADQIRGYLKDFRYSLSALRDPSHVLVKQAHAQITPEAAVFGRQGHLIYHGRIDDLYVAFGRARQSPTTHELEDAIEAALAGHAAAKQEVAGVGCYISDLE